MSADELPGLRLPALDPATVPPRGTSGYPEPFRSRVLPREKRALGNALGLSKIGVNLTTLPPGKESSVRHFHTREDEMVFVIEGEVVLRTDEGEQVLSAGMCAGFPAGVRNAHHVVNRSNRPARYLEISNRDPSDEAEYPHDDLAVKRAPDGSFTFTTKSGQRDEKPDR
ncbi:MAG TPA: cupin domain-containing protein [Polyangiaceae bacterium]|nr:cupin domain-containing protein [Polyangiaceae bacterium]